MVGAASSDCYHRRWRARTEPLCQVCERCRVLLKLIFNAIGGFGSFPIHDSFRRIGHVASVYKRSKI